MKLLFRNELLSLVGGTRALKIVLPVAAVFTIFYVSFRNMDLFKTRRMDLAASVVLSASMVYFTPFRTGGFYNYLSNLFGLVSVFLVFLAGFFLVEGFFLGGRAREVIETHSGKFLAVIILSFLLLFFVIGGVNLLSGAGFVGQVNFFIDRKELYVVVLIGGLTALVISGLD